MVYQFHPVRDVIMPKGEPRTMNKKNKEKKVANIREGTYRMIFSLT